MTDITATQDIPDLPGHLQPDYRRLRVLKTRRLIVQGLIVVLAVAAVVWIAVAMKQSFAARGVAFSFDYLAGPAGFQISEGVVPTLDDGLVPFASSMTNTQALIAAMINTIKMAMLAIVLATVIGSAMGLGKLSTNFLIRTACFHIVEFLRNTPLLIQVTFWYTAVVLNLPSVTALEGFFGIFVARQGVWIPWFQLSPEAPILALVALGLASVAAVLILLVKAFRRWEALAAIAVLVGVAIATGAYTTDIPKIGKFNATGGLRLSAEFTALLIAITLGTAGHIGEIVRGAIEGMPRGQWEASAALGLSRRATLSDIILPQVFRVVLPAFGNKYISLAKDTSLGIAIGFPDLFNVSGTIANQSGRMLETIGIVMGLYLLMSITISFCVNLLNARLGRKEKR